MTPPDRDPTAEAAPRPGTDDYDFAPDTYDEAAIRVHRAFCEPDHELVGEWDRSMAEALARNGYAIVRAGADELGAAWKRAEALCKRLGWQGPHLGMNGSAALDAQPYLAGAWLEAEGGPHIEWEHSAEGPTPAAALIALSEKLEAHRGWS